MILKSDNYRIFRGDERVGLDGFYALLESNWTGECASTVYRVPTRSAIPNFDSCQSDKVPTV